MKKLLFAAMILLACAACDRRQTGPTAESLSTELQSRDSLLNEVFATLGEITYNLNRIKERENIISGAIDNAEIRRDPTLTIREDIEAIDRLLVENRQTIQRLGQSAETLRRANIKIGSLENLIAEITTQLEQKDAEIKELMARIEQANLEMEELNVQIIELSGSNTQLEEIVSAQQEALNTAYYIVGSRDKLISKEIVYKSGFIGRTLKFNENYPLESFTRVGIDSFDQVIIGQKNVDIVTSHPENSYEFVRDERDVYISLVITDPEQFWRLSRVLVISYK